MRKAKVTEAASQSMRRLRMCQGSAEAPLSGAAAEAAEGILEGEPVGTLLDAQVRGDLLARRPRSRWKLGRPRRRRRAPWHGQLETAVHVHEMPAQLPVRGRGVAGHGPGQDAVVAAGLRRVEGLGGVLQGLEVRGAGVLIPPQPPRPRRRPPGRFGRRRTRPRP